MPQGSAAEHAFTAVKDLIGKELGRSPPSPIAAVAAELARRGGNATAAVLYYGSTLRADDPDGILDFYVLMDHVSMWPGSFLAHLANRLLPPNVGYLELAHEGRTLRAKYAVLSSRQFEHGASLRSIDTTIWARFCQPAICAWKRSEEDFNATAAMTSRAVVTATHWAAHLGPESAEALDFWRSLFSRTYAAELRVEQTTRPADIVSKQSERYAALLPLGLQASRIAFGTPSPNVVTPAIPAARRSSATRSWSWRARLGRPLNVLRLLKAAFTFAGALDYVAWKIERHRGVRIRVSPWQRRFPLLAAPALYWQLRKLGILR